jgi:hypothetical protein
MIFTGVDFKRNGKQQGFLQLPLWFAKTRADCKINNIGAAFGMHDS